MVDINATAAAAVNSSYGKSIASGSSVAQAAQQAIQQGAGQAATAGCVATGALAGVAPLCGLVGGAIGKPLGKFIGHVIDDVGSWVSGLFSGKKPVYYLVEKSDAPEDPSGYFLLYQQVAQADYLLAVAFMKVVTGIGDMLTQAGLVPNPDAIATAMQPALGLIQNNGIPGNYSTFAEPVMNAAQNPEVHLTVPWIPPKFRPLGEAIQKGVSKATWNAHPDFQAQYAAQMQAVIDKQVAWAHLLEVEAGRQMALAGTDAVIARAYSEHGSDPPVGSVTESGQAAALVAVWHVLNGETDGVQFLRPPPAPAAGAPAPSRSMAPTDQAAALVDVWFVLHGTTDGVQFLRPNGSNRP